MDDGFRNHKSLAGLERNRAVFVPALNIDQQLPANYVEELIVIVVPVPVVFALDRGHAHHGIIDLAEGLIEPLVIAGAGNRMDIDEFERAVQDVEASFVRERRGFSHGANLCEERIARRKGSEIMDHNGDFVFAVEAVYDKGMTIEEVRQKAAPILEQHGVTFAAVFGSLARGEDRPQSDVDILVRLGRPTGMVGYMRLVQSLESALEKHVDVVTEQSLNERVRPYVMPDLTTIYEK